MVGRDQATYDPAILSEEPSNRGRTKVPVPEQTGSIEKDPAYQRAVEIAARAQEEVISMKRRTDKQRSDQEIKVTAKLVLELIPALDDFELALRSAGVDPTTAPASDNIMHGVSLLFRRLVGVLGGFGVQAFDPHGEVFDPNRHEALATAQVSEVPAGVVVRTLNSGYMLGDRTLRAARVTVSA